MKHKASAPVLQQKVAEHIGKKTGGRVRDVSAELVEGRLVVKGWAESQHVKQLALLAAMDMLEQTRATQVELHVVVGRKKGPDRLHQSK